MKFATLVNEESKQAIMKLDFNAGTSIEWSLFLYFNY